MSAPSPTPLLIDVAQCHACQGFVKLVRGFVLRKHLNHSLPTSLPRRDRICQNSATRKWTAMDVGTTERATKWWAYADGQS